MNPASGSQEKSYNPQIGYCLSQHLQLNSLSLTNQNAERPKQAPRQKRSPQNATLLSLSNVFSETSLEVDVSRRSAGRTCLMFVCVHQLHVVTQRAHTSFDVITTAHLFDSRLHQSSKGVFLHIHVLTSPPLPLSLPMLHALLFVILGYALRAW